MTATAELRAIITARDDASRAVATASASLQKLGLDAQKANQLAQQAASKGIDTRNYQAAERSLRKLGLTSQEAARMLQDAGIKGAAAGQKIAATGNQVANAAGGWERFVTTLGKVGLGVFAIQQIGGAVVRLAGSMTSGNAEFERYEVQLGVLLGSADAAKARLAELADFGARTPFELPEIVRADKILTAFGLDTETTLKRFRVSAAQIRETVGDVAAGTGASFEEIAGTFGRFASGATGEAIQRFQEMGIATREQMREWGLQFEDSGQLITPAVEAFAVLERNVRAKFGGMMEAQSETFEGMMSNLSDWVGMAKRTIMQPVFDVLKDSLKGVLDLLGSPAAKAGLAALAQGMARGVASVIGGLKTAGRAVRDFLKYLDPANTRDLMREWFGDFGYTIDQFVRGLKDGIRAVADFVDSFHDNWVEIGQVLQQEGLPGVARYITDWLGDEFRKIQWGSVWRRVRGIGEGLARSAVNIGSQVVTWLGVQWAAIPWAEVWRKVKGVGEGLARSALSIAGAVGAWIALQWSAIDWGAVWSAVRGVGEGLLRSALSIGASVGTWIAQQWSGIDWAATWAAVRGVGEGLLKSALDIASSVQTWVTAQWAKINWVAIWGSIVKFADGLEAKIAELAGAVFDWLKGVWSGIGWQAIWEAAGNFAAGLEKAIAGMVGSLRVALQAAFDEAMSGVTIKVPEVPDQPKQVGFLQQVLDTLKRLAGELPSVAEAIFKAVTSLTDLSAKLAESVSKIPAKDIGQAIGKLITDAIAGLAVAVAGAIGSLFAGAFAAVKEDSGVIDAIKDMLAFQIDFLERLYHQADILFRLATVGGDILNSITAGMVRETGRLLEPAGRKIIDILVNAINAALPLLRNAGVFMARNMWAGFDLTFQITKAHNAGRAIAEALSDGLRSIALTLPSVTVPGASGRPPQPRQAGGPVYAGLAYVVGERGPEIFAPQRSGTILPSSGAGGGMNISVAVDMRGSTVGSAGDVQRLGEEIAERASRKVWTRLISDRQTTIAGGVVA